MRTLHTAGLLVLTLIATACSSDENDDQITDAQGTLIATAIGDQISTIPNSFTATGVAGAAGGGGIFFSKQVLGPRAMGIGVAPQRIRALCPNVTGDLSDPDTDDVPADALLTFVSPDCDGTTDGGDPFTVTGTVRIQDLPSAAVGYTATFGSLETTVTTTTGSIALEFDGSHSVSGTAGLASLTEDLTIHVLAQGAGGTINGTVTNDWTISFTAPGDNLEMGQPLPDGAFDVDGTFFYRVNGVRARFEITTEDGLDFDSSCVGDYPFAAGQLRAHLVGEDANVFARIIYTGCNETPDVTFFGRNSQ